MKRFTHEEVVAKYQELKIIPETHWNMIVSANGTWQMGARGDGCCPMALMLIGKPADAGESLSNSARLELGIERVGNFYSGFDHPLALNVTPHLNENEDYILGRACRKALIEAGLVDWP